MVILSGLPACAEFMVKWFCAGPGPPAEQHRSEAPRSPSVQPPSAQRNGPAAGPGSGVRFLGWTSTSQWGGLTSGPRPGPLGVRICIFHKTRGDALACRGGPRGLTAEVSENHEY